MEKVKMMYFVPDVEHMGDVDSEERRLTQMGAKVIDTDICWGSEEIEEATIFIEVNKADEQIFFDYGCYK